MGCLPGKQQKLQIQVIKHDNIISNINEKNSLDEKANVCIYKQKNNEDFNKQTGISQNIQSLIDNNPLPFVKIKKKKMQWHLFICN